MARASGIPQDEPDCLAVDLDFCDVVLEDRMDVHLRCTPDGECFVS